MRLGTVYLQITSQSVPKFRLQGAYTYPTGHVTLFLLADKMKWWQIALLVIVALTVVPGIVVIITGIMISCFKKGT